MHWTVPQLISTALHVGRRTKWFICTSKGLREIASRTCRPNASAHVILGQAEWHCCQLSGWIDRHICMPLQWFFICDLGTRIRLRMLFRVRGWLGEKFVFPNLGTINNYGLISQQIKQKYSAMLQCNVFYIFLVICCVEFSNLIDICCIMV